MIVSITGSSAVGKSTFLSGFLKQYPNYNTPELTYRDLPNLSLYKSGTRESQEAIRGFMFDQHQMYWLKRDTNKNVIHDRCLLDNLACTLWLWLAHGEEVIPTEFLKESFEKTKKSMSYAHVIYFLPISKFTPVTVRDDLDLSWRKDIDFILNRFFESYDKQDPELLTKTFDLPFEADLFPDKNCSAIFEIYGNEEEIILNASIGLDETGNPDGGIDNMGVVDTPPTIYDGSGKEVNINSMNAPFDVTEEGTLVDLEYKPDIITKW